MKLEQQLSSEIVNKFALTRTNLLQYFVDITDKAPSAERLPFASDTRTSG